MRFYHPFLSSSLSSLLSSSLLSSLHKHLLSTHNVPGPLLGTEDLVMKSNQFLTVILCLVEERETMFLHPGDQVGHLYSLTE